MLEYHIDKEGREDCLEREVWNRIYSDSAERREISPYGYDDKVEKCERYLRGCVVWKC